MPKASEVCQHVRSKNAGPFWVTVDLAFPDRKSFDRYASSEALSPPAVARLYDVKISDVKHFLVPDLRVLKISYARKSPQGGAMERDMHGGQQYVRLLDVNLE